MGRAYGGRSRGDAFDYAGWTIASGHDLPGCCWPSVFLGLAVVLVFKLGGFRQGCAAHTGGFHCLEGTLQPSDLMRLALVVYLAESLSRRQGLVRDLVQGYLPHIAIVGAAMGMVMLQPDLGTALAIGLTCTLMLYLAGVRVVKHLAGTGMGAAAAIVCRRICSGISKGADDDVPESHGRRTGRRLSCDAVFAGAGEVEDGQAWGSDRVCRNICFCREPHTDFVFSIVGEGNSDWPAPPAW